jgi:hypothetical protein
MPLSVALIRAHLNLDDDRDADLLTHYGNVAEAWVRGHLPASRLTPVAR